MAFNADPRPKKYFIREAARKEGRPLAGMIHKLISEAILARQAAQHQTQKLVSLIRGESSDYPATS